MKQKDKYFYSRNYRRQLRKSTTGWKLKVLWNEGSSTWMPLKDLKESIPVDVAEFAVARGIDKAPAFVWWVTHTLKKRNAMISEAISKARKVSHKYSIELPSTVKKAYE